MLPLGVKKRTKVIKNNVNPVWNEVSAPRLLSLWGTAPALRVPWELGASPARCPKHKGLVGPQ